MKKEESMWRGVKLKDMSKDELIEAFCQCNQLAERHRLQNETELDKLIE